MEFLDFLKYGAIGISLALAILSYRLLAAEQKKSEVSIPMLNSIKWYMGLALTLSIFFGFIEVFSSDNASEIVDEIWQESYSEYEDSTYTQKLNRIRDHATLYADYDDVSNKYSTLENDYSSLEENYNNCVQELSNGGESDQEIFELIADIDEKFSEYERNWFYLKNLNYMEDDQENFFKLINRTLIALGPYSDTNHSRDKIAEDWAAFIEPQYDLRKNLKNDPHYHIQKSDLTIIINKYIQHL